jgi:hypothetical protein
VPVYDGPAILQVADFDVEIHAVLHLVHEPAGATSWSGVFSTADEFGAESAMTAQGEDAPVWIILAGEQEPARVTITHLRGAHGDLHGTGPPPARLAQ